MEDLDKGPEQLYEQRSAVEVDYAVGLAFQALVDPKAEIVVTPNGIVRWVQSEIEGVTRTIATKSNQLDEWNLYLHQIERSQIAESPDSVRLVMYNLDLRTGHFTAQNEDVSHYQSEKLLLFRTEEMELGLYLPEPGDWERFINLLEKISKQLA